MRARHRSLAFPEWNGISKDAVSSYKEQAGQQERAKPAAESPRNSSFSGGTGNKILAGVVAPVNKFLMGLKGIPEGIAISKDAVSSYKANAGQQERVKPATESPRSSSFSGGAGRPE